MLLQCLLVYKIYYVSQTPKERKSEWRCAQNGPKNKHRFIMLKYFNVQKFQSMYRHTHLSFILTICPTDCFITSMITCSFLKFQNVPSSSSIGRMNWTSIYENLQTILQLYLAKFALKYRRCSTPLSSP